MTLRRELQTIVDQLIEQSNDSRTVTLDEIGEAIGTRAVSPDEIDRMLDALETRGRTVAGPEGGGGEARLKKVLDAARTFVAQNGRRPTVDEIARASGLSKDEVSTALALARVMQR